MPSILTNDLEIAYETVGEGPPLVLVHGAAASGRDTFAAQIPALARTFRVYLPDARGHAQTRWDVSDGFRTAAMVDDLAAFVEGMGLDAFHLFGLSMGAMTALTFAARHGDRVRSLVVACISPLREPRASVVRRLLDPTRIERDDPAWAVALAQRHDPSQGPGAWRQLLPAIAVDVATQPLLSPGELHGIGVPALVIVGDRDPFVPVDQAWGLARQLGDGRLLVVPDGPHDVLVKRPGIVNEALLGFYRWLPLPGHPNAGDPRPSGTTQRSMPGGGAP